VSSASANRRGMIALAVGMAAFSANDTCLKLIATRYPLGEVIVIRGVFTVALVGAVLLWMGHVTALGAIKNRMVFTRTLLDGAAMLLFTSALVHMRIADLSAINLASPLIITALAVIVHREQVGWRRWSAILVGFIGVLFVVKPTPSAFDIWALVGLGCAFAGASRDLMTRSLDPGIPAIVISFMAAVGATLVGLGLGFWEVWRPMALADIGVVAISAVFLAIGNFLIVIAFRSGEVAVVAPFRYTLLIWAALGGYLAFGEVPDGWAIIGAALIVGSGLYALHREVVRRRALTAPLGPAE
jgi:drug/metabolite transporter (DMT)-like permease